MAAENTCPYNTVDCPCTKDCPRHGKCCECVKHHRGEGAKLPACLRTPQKPQPIPPEIKADLRVQKLVKVVGKQTLPRRQIMADLGLKQTSRQTFIDKYYKPALQLGLIHFAYPNSPNKPIQTYRLTANGLLLYSQLTGKDWF